MEFRVKRNAGLDYLQVHELRLAVGWTSDPERQRKEIENCYSNFSIVSQGVLIGYLNIISDGVSDALLNNLMVHPDYQRKGVGTKLVKTAVDELTRDGVKFFNLVFNDELVPFYKKCGFHIMRSGIIDLWNNEHNEAVAETAA